MHLFAALIFILASLPVVAAPLVYTDPAEFDAATADLGIPKAIDFEDIDTGPISDTHVGRDEFNGNFYARQGIIFRNPNDYPLYISPGGSMSPADQVWNTSNSLSVGNFPFDPNHTFDLDDDLTVILDPPCTAVGFTLVDSDTEYADEFIQFIDSGGDVLAKVGLPVGFAPYLSFVGVVSLERPIGEIKVVEAPNDGDDVNYDDFILYPAWSGFSCKIIGTLVDADTSSPIAGAVIKVDGMSTQTDSRGRFESSLPPSRYKLSASAKGYLIRDKQVQVDRGGTAEVLLSALPVLEVWPGDTDNDGKVSVLDIIPIGRFWDETGDGREPKETTWQMGLTPIMNWNPKEAAFADANGDGFVEAEDVLVIALNWRKEQPRANSAPEVIDPGPLLAGEDMPYRYGWMYQALREMGDCEGSIALREILERLIDGLRTEESRLLANYPNPLNPETWIPYQLAEDADATVRIYSVVGKLVRTLRLGHKRAGVYATKQKAVYWDGKNEAGEQVSSGIYFYNIQAGDFSATRKMAVAE